jgi:hypothetical protein
LAKPVCLGNSEALAGPTDIHRVFLIAVNIAKLPSVPPQILKDIPQPDRQAAERAAADIEGHSAAGKLGQSR